MDRDDESHYLLDMSSMVENAIYRYKTIIGRDMRSRCLDAQRVEVQIACKILNRMTKFGVPDSAKVA
mgnify:CR=1 FL=1